MDAFVGVKADVNTDVNTDAKNIADTDAYAIAVLMLSFQRNEFTGRLLNGTTQFL